MDGSNVKIISDCKVVALTIDHNHENIFWVDEDIGIIRTNYDGYNRKVLTYPLVNIKSLAFFKNQLYWSLPAYKDENARIKSCKLINDTCRFHESLSIHLENYSIVRFYSFLSENYQKNDNPCKENNGNCEQLCLLVPHNKSHCACRVGYKLNSDLQSCGEISKFIMYVEKNYVKGISLHSNQNSSSQNAFVPTPLFPESSNEVNEIVDFEYDFVNDNFYFIANNSINVISITQKKIMIHKLLWFVKGNYKLTNLAYDWMSGNLYFLLHSKKDHIQMGIVKNNCVLKTVIYDENLNSRDNFFYVNVNRGKVFYTQCSSDGSQNLNQIELDGSNLTKVHKFPVKSGIKSFALDHEKNKIYYLYNRSNSIAFSNFDSTVKEDLQMNISIAKINSMHLYKDSLYISDDSSIWRLDKNNSFNATKIIPKREHNWEKKISGTKIVIAHLNNAENQCASDNGNCEQFCFAKPIKHCGYNAKKAQENYVHCFNTTN